MPLSFTPPRVRQPSLLLLLLTLLTLSFLGLPHYLSAHPAPLASFPVASPTHGGDAPPMIINEFYYDNTSMATGNEWIEVLLVEDLTPTELENFVVGDSTSSTQEKAGTYRFTDMDEIADTFYQGTLIVVGGSNAFTQTTTYDPLEDDWTILVHTSGGYAQGSSGNLASDDLVYVDAFDAPTNTISIEGFVVNYGSPPGTLGSSASVTVTAPESGSSMALLSDFDGATEPGNWSNETNQANRDISLGEPNGGDNTTYIDGLRSSLAVTLAAFEAAPTSEHIRVSWETISELDNLGFNLYRSADPHEVGTALNEELIPAQAPGSGQGASYEWLDETAEVGATYYYWLEDVDGNGSTTLHGPVSATVAGAPTALTLETLRVSNRPAWPLIGALALLTLAGTTLVQRRRQR